MKVYLIIFYSIFLKYIIFFKDIDSKPTILEEEPQDL